MKLRKHDPDSYLLQLRTKSKINNWLCQEEDYLSEYLLRECMEKAEEGAKAKADQIKVMAETLELIPDDVLRQTYYDNVANDWSAFKKSYKLKKREDAAKIQGLDKLKKNERADFFDFGFIEKDGAYWSMDGRGKTRICNFTLEMLYFVISSEEPKYVCQITNMFGEKHITAITTDNFTSVGTFRKSVGRFGNFIFDGTDQHLNRIKTKLFHGVKKAIEPKYMGWNIEGKFYTWANGLYNEGHFFKADKYGMVQIKIPITTINDFKRLPSPCQILMNDEIFSITFVNDFIEEQGAETIEGYISANAAYLLNFYYLPFASSLKLFAEDDSEDTFQFERMFKYNPEGISFNEWAQLFYEVYGDNGIIGICFYIMALFRDIVFRENNSYTPMLGGFGPRQSGKSTWARSLCRLFGDPLPDGMNLESGSTTTAAGRYMASYSNALVWLNEYKNSLSDSVRGMIKGISDGNGKITGRKTSGNQVKVGNPRSCAILTGQDLPTKDPAIYSRNAACEFDGKRRKHEKFNELTHLEAENKLTTVTTELLAHRHLVQMDYGKLSLTQKAALRESYVEKEMRVDDRLLVNIVSLTAPIAILKDAGKIELPFTWEKLEEVIEDKLTRQLAIQATADDVEAYFTVLMSMCGTPNFKYGEHYDIKKTSSGSVKLFLRTGAYHNSYERACNSGSGTPMSLGSIRAYLEKHYSFLEKKSGIRFKNLNNPTSAHLFDYELLQAAGIEFSMTESINEMPFEL
ncbi:MAG: hypothetical protein ACFB2Y_09735 [Fulvivirga sp.]